MALVMRNKIKAILPVSSGIHRVLCLGMTAATLFLFSAGAMAQTTPCDPEYMDALKARAWMEAQREISQNQQLIFKPDSVLEYSCFGAFLNRAASGSGMTNNRLFSAVGVPGVTLPGGFGTNATAGALNAMVGAPMASYLGSNFPDSFLDGRIATNYTPGAVSPSASYNCTMMQQVWQQARCMNFMNRANTDGFFDFNWYADNDPRSQRPPSFQCTGASPTIDGLANTTGGAGAFNRAMAVAFNDRQGFFIMPDENEPVLDGTRYAQDDIVSHLERILPGACNNSFRVPTGVRVQRPDMSPATYNEFICTQPGCSYVPTGMDAGTCEPP